MRRAKCLLCRKLSGEESVTFFRVPKLLHQRQRWIDLTGVDFKISDYVCQDHFTPRDFINGPGESAKRARLQPGAVPSLCIPEDLRSATAEPLLEEQILSENDACDSEGEISAPICNICNKPCPKGQVSLYPPPRNSTTHARWNAACGMLLKERSRVCERHFREEDFHRTGKRTRLNENAIPSRFLYCNDSTEEENDDSLFQNVECIDEDLIDVKPDECDQEDFMQYSVDADHNQDFVSKAVQKSLADDAQTCGFIRLKAEKKIYSVHCFYCDDIFAIWDWKKFVKHIHEQHSNNADDQQSVLSQQHVESSENPTWSSKKHLTKRLRRRSPTPTFSKHSAEITKTEPEFFAVEELEEVAALTENLNENYFGEEEYLAETIKDKKKCIKDAATSSTDDSDGGSGYSEFEVGKHGKSADNSRKVPLPCHQIYFAKTDSAIIFGFLELWKLFPVLWQRRKAPKHAAYDAAITELTEEVNANLELTITEAGMNASLSRLLNWHRLYGHTSSTAQHKFKEYYEKCSEFLTPNSETLSVGCNRCSQFFSSEEELREHEVTRHKQYCDLCRKNFRTPSSYRKHAAVQHGPLRFTCDICGRKYRNDQSYREHLKAHRDERNYVCDKCGKAFVRQKNLREHKRKKHPSEENGNCRRPTCDICQINFSDYGGLSYHRRKYHLVLEGTIEELEHGVRAYDSKKGNRDPLVRGKRTLTWIEDPVTKQRRVVCDVCGNNYARSGHLSRHQERHHGYVRPGLIVKKTKQKMKNITEGNEINSDDDASDAEESLRNDENELERVLSSDALKSYLVEGPAIRKRKLTWIDDPVTKARRVVCDVCGNNYARSSALTRHQEKQHGYIRPVLLVKAALHRIKINGNENEKNSDDAASDFEEYLQNDEDDVNDDEEALRFDEETLQSDKESLQSDEEALQSDFDEFDVDNEAQDMNFQKSFLNDLKKAHA